MSKLLAAALAARAIWAVAKENQRILRCRVRVGAGTLVALAACLLAVPASLGAQVAAPAADSAVTVVLVRHAERLDDSPNSPLNDIGRARVERLRTLLADVDFTHVHSTNLTRTLDTARPIAGDDGVELTLYGAGELDELAVAIRATPGRHLVSGHSNTTPRLAEALGGESHGPIDHMEYDRLYIIVIQPGRPAVTTLLRF